VPGLRINKSVPLSQGYSMVDKNNDQAFFAPTDAILESISDGVFTVDMNWRVTSFNRAAEEITGIPRKEALGRLCSEVFKSSMCEAECALQRTLKSGKPVINKSGYIIDAEGDVFQSPLLPPFCVTETGRSLVALRHSVI